MASSSTSLETAPELSGNKLARFEMPARICSIPEASPPPPPPPPPAAAAEPGGLLGAAALAAAAVLAFPPPADISGPRALGRLKAVLLKVARYGHYWLVHTGGMGKADFI